MARYIDVDALIREYDRVHIGLAGGARKLMVDAPTADVAEVKHGEWETKENRKFCSECGSPAMFYEGGTCFATTYRQIKTLYCPCCGAKMDGE